MNDEHASRGHAADWPSEIPPRGWGQILWRVYEQAMVDRVMLVAAGATFYLLLALFPAMTAFISIYGFFADPVAVSEHITTLGVLLPAGGLDIIQERLQSLANQGAGSLSVGFLVGLTVALWSANNGIKTMFDALNIAYGETEKRGFIMLNLLALIFTLGMMLTAVLAITAIGIVPLILSLLPLDTSSERVLSLARWPLLLIVIGGGLSILYRYGPSREPAKWRWVGWGSVVATILWLAASAGFSYYLQNFANYEATYGSLGAVIGFMMWTWISLIIIFLGAELNAEMEHQTERDSTSGPEAPIGERGAVMADTVATDGEHENK